jgi:hypothetical protein
MPVIVTVLLLLRLVKVAVLDTDWLPMLTVPKLRVDGVSETRVPTPLKFTICEPLPSLSMIVNVPYRVPVVLGLKVTPIEQLRPAPRLLPQLVTSL